MNRLCKFAALTALTLLTSCQSVGDTLSVNREPLTVTEQAALAVGMDYETALRTISASGKAKDEPVAQAPQLAEDGTPLPPAPPLNPSFGREIGRFYMGDNYVVHRHATRQAVPVVEPALDPVTSETLPVQAPSAPLTRIALTYFLVTPQGIVDDYATGSLDVATTSCIDFSGFAPMDCGDSNRLSRDFELFDAAMRTSKGLPVSSWSPSPAEQPAPVSQ